MDLFGELYFQAKLNRIRKSTLQKGAVILELQVKCNSLLVFERHVYDKDK